MERYRTYMKVDVQYAETHLSDLIAAASRGEIVVIDTPNASAHLSASPKPDANGSVADAPKSASRAHLAGAWEGLFPVLSDEYWTVLDKKLDKEIEDEMGSSAISYRAAAL